jgi:hypothetical protein
MPRTCTVCAHANRPTIDRTLVAGQEALRTIADRFSVSKTALGRHKENHLPATLAVAREAEQAASADDLLSQVRDLQGRAFAILDRAEGTGDLRTALGAIREARGNLELLTRLLGKLDERPQINVLISPEWLDLRSAIIGALGTYPEARESILKALEGLDGG